MTNITIRYRQLIFLTLITILSMVWIFLINADEFSAHESKFFILYVGGVLLAQLCVIGLLSALRRVFAPLDYGVSLVATLFCAFNVYTILLVHNTRFTQFEGIVLIAFIIGFLAICAVPFFVTHKKTTQFLHMFAGIMTVILGLQFLGDDHVSIKGVLDRIPAHFNAVEFEKTPNVYLVSFDALAPEAVIRNNLGLETVPYVEWLKEQDTRILPNSFAENIPTKRSLNLLLAMDKDYYNTVSERYGFIRDQVPNPTYEMFRQNGYKIQFLYENRYFGNAAGRLDYYGIAKSYGICKHIEKPYSFVGFCTDMVQNTIKSSAGIHQHEFPKMLFDRIKETAKSDQPWFTFASIYTPGHAKNSTQYNNQDDIEEYRQNFKVRSQHTIKPLSDLIETIQTHDPDSITIIFGDHGSMLTQGALDDYNRLSADSLERGEENFQPDSPFSFAQVVHDRHATLTAVMPANVCPENFTQNPYSNLRFIRDIAICLSGKDPLPADFQPNDARWGPYKYE